MSLAKRTYVDNETVITAENLNDIQDAIIDLEADESVTTNKIADGAVTTDKLANGAVTGAKIANANITADKLANSAVTGQKINNLAVGTAKLADGPVPTEFDASFSSVTAEVARFSVLTAYPAIFADLIAPSAIFASVTAESAILSVVTGHIKSNAVTASQLASNAVTQAKIASGAVTKAKLAIAVQEQIDAATSDISDLNDALGDITTLTTEDKTSAVDAINELEEKKANTDGYYEEMTVGDAEQLVSTQYVEDEVPYKFRTSGGSADIGNRAYIDKIVGGSLVWNQLIPNGNFNSPNNEWWIPNTSTMQIANNKCTVSVSTANRNLALQATLPYLIQSGHVYLETVTITSSKVIYPRFGYSGDSVQPYKFFNRVSANTRTVCSTIKKTTSSATNGSFYLYLDLGDSTLLDSGDTVVIENLMLIDLTTMFGTTIANYIHSLEQSTAGAGVQWFRKYFPADFYPYNAGEMIHVSGLSSHDTVGFNQWDEEWRNGYYDQWGDFHSTSGYVANKNPISVFPATDYCFTTLNQGLGRVCWYDSDMNVINAFTTGNNYHLVLRSPINAHYLNFDMTGAYGGTYKNDICINLSWSGTRNGEYEPYQKHSYALDDSLTLRGLFELDSNGNLVANGDEYLPSDEVSRRFSEITFDGSSDESWFISGNTDNNQYGIVIDDLFAPSDFGDLLCNRLDKISAAEGYNTDTIVGIGTWYDATNPQLRISLLKSTVNRDVSAFRTWLSNNPITVVYPLKSTTTETADPYNEVQIVDDWGTEEFVSTTIVPVGHETRYPQNLRDKLQHLPNLASADGDYAIRQTGSQMALVPLQDVKELPTEPSADGVYYLKVTVSNGTATLAWVAE